MGLQQTTSTSLNVRSENTCSIPRRDPERAAWTSGGKRGDSPSPKIALTTERPCFGPNCVICRDLRCTALKRGPKETAALDLKSLPTEELISEE